VTTVAVAVVDYGASNIKSIVRGLERAGAAVTVARTPEEMSGAAGLVLPGVGAAGAAMRGLRERGLAHPLTRAIEGGAPFLGVCLGMQLLLGAQEEDDETGLNIIGGRVRRLRGAKVPHMGWNTVDALPHEGAPADGPLSGLPSQPYLYFVHSYYVELDPAEREAAAATTEYGDGAFVSTLARDNVWGAQFHPEKSGENGARVLRNFVARCAGATATAPNQLEAAS
jgi:glutamine amidotransferase